MGYRSRHPKGISRFIRFNEIDPDYDRFMDRHIFDPDPPKRTDGPDTVYDEPEHEWELDNDGRCRICGKEYDEH